MESRRLAREKAAQSCYPQCRLDLTEDEKSLLEEWAQGEGRVAQRAKAILGASRTHIITEISRYSGLYRGSIYFWLERFKIERLNGIFRNELCGLTFIERQQLEAAKSGSDPRVAKRAAFILEIAQKPDLASAAEKLGISIKAARLWRRTFKRAGVEGLVHRTNDRLEAFSELNHEELALLRQWSTAGRAFSRRATLILALAEGESVSAAAARVGVSKSSVSYWRKQFIRRGLNAIAPKRLLAVQGNERDLLKELQSDPSSKVSRRASLLLDFRECGDLMGAAKRLNVSLTSARNWKRAFEQRGVAGVKNPKLAPPSPPPRSPLPLVLPIQLPVDVRVRREGQDIEASGVTTTLSSRYFTVALNDDGNQVVRINLGARVTAHVQWPTAGLEGKRLRLRIVGSVLQSHSTTICISIRTFAFESA